MYAEIKQQSRAGGAHPPADHANTSVRCVCHVHDSAGAGDGQTFVFNTIIVGTWNTVASSLSFYSPSRYPIAATTTVTTTEKLGEGGFLTAHAPCSPVTPPPPSSFLSIRKCLPNSGFLAWTACAKSTFDHLMTGDNKRDISVSTLCFGRHVVILLGCSSRPLFILAILSLLFYPCYSILVMLSLLCYPCYAILVILPLLCYPWCDKLGILSLLCYPCNSIIFMI